ncbi:hypothetical protein HMI56_004772 [Coelomomyces lativittatus]|nr:hypothetical protein HMI56_004772 [Coelomomyces lativittatus]
MPIYILSKQNSIFFSLHFKYIALLHSKLNDSPDEEINSKTLQSPSYVYPKIFSSDSNQIQISIDDSKIDVNDPTLNDSTLDLHTSVGAQINSENLCSFNNFSAKSSSLLSGSPEKSSAESLNIPNINGKCISF